MNVENFLFPLFFCSILLLSLYVNVYATSENNDVEVGVFYYVWYNPDDSASWEYPKIHDKPVLGYYNSCDSAVIKQHLNWMSEARIDFLIVSWWGMYNQTSWNSFINNATYQIFKTAKETVSNVKVCIMVEPFNETASGYNYTEIYNYVYSTFYMNYPTVYFKYEGKPLLLFYNSEYLTADGTVPEDNRFTVKIVGHCDYAEWIYDDVATTHKPNPPIPRERQIPVSPRFDDYYVRNPNCTIDAKLEYLYVEQWERAVNLAQEGKIDIITITSWNEFPERTAIEPHYDSTASNRDSYYLFKLTKNYILQLKDPASVPADPWYENPRNYAIVMVLIGFCIIVGRWMYERF